MVAFAIIFLGAIFVFKNKSTLFPVKNGAENQNSGGLAVGDEKLVDLINKDTDGDGIPDWEESLWGTDPTKKETTPGIPDTDAIAKLKAQSSNGTNVNTDDTNLTQTDKFSREFLATVTTLSANGALDQTTVDKLSSSLADRIQNTAPRKVYTLNDVKITQSDASTIVQKYYSNLNSIFKKNSLTYTVVDVLQKFEGDGENIDVSALNMLDPIIQQTNGYIAGMQKMDIPQSLANLHLNVLNALERIIENISDIKQYNTDVIVSLTGINQYDQNSTLLNSALENLDNAIAQKLSN